MQWAETDEDSTPVEESPEEVEASVSEGTPESEPEEPRENVQ